VPNAKDIGVRAVTAVHRAVFRITGGRLAGTGFGMPVLELTTIGRKSGKARTTMLTSPVQYGDTMILVASFGGDDRNPAWFLNLRDHPDVEVAMGGETRPMRARIASADEKSTLWPQVVAAYQGYAQYQTRTERDIPLVILEQRPSEGAPDRAR
jgi:deazaflavin-dependent oxidoreductase (nitroreductase family)